MSGVNGKTELPPLLVSRSEFRFPLANVAEPTWLDTPSWVGIDITRMAQCNRVQRPPPPPHYIAQSKKALPHNGGSDSDGPTTMQMEPVQRVKQLEKNLTFLKESHSIILQGLHREVAELKQKNRELQFQLVVGTANTSPGQESEQLNEEVLPEAQNKLDKLEKEVRKLRTALRDALKANANLSLQLEASKREYFLSKISQVDYTSATETPSTGIVDVKAEGNQRVQTPGGPSPKIEEYNDTLRQIQHASARPRSSKASKSDGRQDLKSNYEWGSGQMEHGRRHPEFQGRLPRLPLRNQQNIQQEQQQQTEIQSLQRTAVLPTLKKPLFPTLERSEKPRKPRGYQRPRFIGNLHQP